MENTTPVAVAKKKRMSPLTKGAGAVVVGAALLYGGGSLAGWQDSHSIGTEGQKIQAGQLALDTTSIGWAFNGTAIAEADLDTLGLSPGDNLTYSGTATPTLEGTNLAAEMSLSAAATSGVLAANPVTDIEWTIDSGSTAKKLTADDSGTAYSVSWSLEMAPAGDPVYQTGKEAQLESLSLGDVEVQLTQVAK